MYLSLCSVVASLCAHHKPDEFFALLFLLLREKCLPNCISVCNLAPPKTWRPWQMPSLPIYNPGPGHAYTYLSTFGRKHISDFSIFVLTYLFAFQICTAQKKLIRKVNTPSVSSSTEVKQILHIFWNKYVLHSFLFCVFFVKRMVEHFSEKPH